METLDQSIQVPYRVKYWDGFELTRRLKRHTGLIAKYWQSEANNSPKVLLEYDPQYFVESFGPNRAGFYANLTFDTFPVFPQNAELIPKLGRFIEDYQHNPQPITVIDGVYGSGKTGYAWSLLNRKRVENLQVAEVHLGDFADFHFAYLFRDDYTFLNLKRFCIEVDYLLLEDFEHSLWDGSDTQIECAKSVIDIVTSRIAAKRPTIIDCFVEKIKSDTLRKNVQYWQTRYASVWMGNSSIRPLLNHLEFLEGWQDAKQSNILSLSEDEETNSVWDEFENVFGSAQGHEVVCVLGKHWLIEKYKSLMDEAEYAVKILLRPDDIDANYRKLFFERTGEKTSREGDVIESLRTIVSDLKRYSDFISPLPFHCISFYSDNSSRLITQSPVYERVMEEFEKINESK